MENEFFLCPFLRYSHSHLSQLILRPTRPFSVFGVIVNFRYITLNAPLRPHHYLYQIAKRFSSRVRNSFTARAASQWGTGYLQGIVQGHEYISGNLAGQPRKK